MKKSLGIGIGIAITAVIVIVAFSNIDDLVSINVEETAKQISKNLEGATSQVEFSNPLQTYEVDSACKLAFMIQNRLEYREPPFKMEENFLENLSKEFEEKAKKQSEELGDRVLLDPELMKEPNLALMEEFKQKTTDHVMDYNSIHPKLRDSLENFGLRNQDYESQLDKVELLNTMYLIQPESYQEDPQCGKQFHERFGDETFQALKTMFGNEELAMKRYNEIKKTISDVVVTNPEGVYDPEGRMLSEEECNEDLFL